jgi:hypothetical protein
MNTARQALQKLRWRRSWRVALLKSVSLQVLAGSRSTESFRTRNLTGAGQAQVVGCKYNIEETKAEVG